MVHKKIVPKRQQKILIQNFIKKCIKTWTLIRQIFQSLSNPNISPEADTTTFIESQEKRIEEGGDAILKFLRASLSAAVFDLTVAGVTRPTEEDPPLLPPPRGPSAPDFNGVFSDLERRGDDLAYNCKIKIWFCSLPLKFV